MMSRLITLMVFTQRGGNSQTNMSIATLCRGTLLSSFIKKSFETSFKQWRYLSTGYQSIREILQRPVTDAENGITVLATGWVRAVRKHKNHVFLHVSDGSSSQHLQIVCEADLFERSQVNYGCSLVAEGILTKSPTDKQALEVEAKSVRVLGDCDPIQYPFKARKKHRLDYVREYLHLRPRTNYFGALLRMRNAASISVHNYFQNNGYCFVHTPILTSSDCEGAGEVFQVVTHEDIVNKNEECNMKKFFNQDTFLTVSSQLHLEAISGAFRKSYSFGPTFRAEKSTGKLHLSEFYMIEAEIAFTDHGVDDLIDSIQDFVKSVTKQIYEKHSDDVEFFEKQIPPDYREAVRKLATDSYQKVSYTEAVNLLLKNNINFNSPISWGGDLKKDHERFLVRHFDNSPVFVYDFPRELKPFYVRSNDDGWTAAAVDLLVPGVGELVGGSIREERYYVLQQRLEELRMGKQYEWYLDLRKFGTVKHGGFGLGFERYLQCLLGIETIKDAIPFPRFNGSCKI